MILVIVKISVLVFECLPINIKGRILLISKLCKVIVKKIVNILVGKTC